MVSGAFRKPTTRGTAYLLGAWLALPGASFALLAGAPAAQAESAGEKIVQRCTHGGSLSGFTQQNYREALSIVASETEVEEYTPCGQIIHEAELTALGGGEAGAGGAGGGGGAAAGGGGGGGSASGLLSAGGASKPIAVSPVEQRKLERAQREPPPAQTIEDETVRPGVIRANVASAASDLPASLQIALAFILACGILAGAWMIAQRLRARRSP